MNWLMPLAQSDLDLGQLEAGCSCCLMCKGVGVDDLCSVHMNVRIRVCQQMEGLLWLIREQAWCLFSGM